jgi:hypothetical protein
VNGWGFPGVAGEETVHAHLEGAGAVLPVASSHTCGYDPAGFALAASW